MSSTSVLYGTLKCGSRSEHVTHGHRKIWKAISQSVNGGSIDSLEREEFLVLVFGFFVLFCFVFSLATSVIRLLLLWPNTHEE